ncbi:MAG: hypothetical protein JWQ33_2249 [Ramlibacter sp.]|nr:hypothetical protein [Ramlibacter sp.]
MTRPATLLLLSLNVLLAGLLVWLWVGPDGTLRGVHWVPPQPIRPDLGSLSATSVQKDDADMNRFMAILDRPVFSPTRRPPPPPPPPKPVVVVRPDPLDTIHLYGLFSGAEGGGVIVRVEGKTRRVKVSESIGDWSLKEIKAREVVFTKAGQSRVVPLMQASQAAGGAPPRPAFSAPGAPAAAIPGPAPAGVTPPAAAAQQPTPAPAPQQPAGGAAGKPAGPPPSNPFVIGGSR